MFEMLRLQFGSPVAFYIHPLVNKHLVFIFLEIVMSNLIFVYGTLKASEPNHHVLLNGGEGINDISPFEKEEFQPATFRCKVFDFTHFCKNNFAILE